MNHISENITNQDLKFLHDIYEYFGSTRLEFQLLTRKKNIIVKILRRLV